jgi:hypothetical protein
MILPHEEGWVEIEIASNVRGSIEGLTNPLKENVQVHSQKNRFFVFRESSSVELISKIFAALSFGTHACPELSCQTDR